MVLDTPGGVLEQLDQIATKRPVIFGILNVTPDSFSDGGRYEHMERAVEHGRWLAAHGADVVDVGGESTRPGAHELDGEAEQARVLPVIETLASEGVTVSVDTRRASVAALALEAGALIVNDVSGMSVSEQMISLISQRQVPYILMHRRGDARTMDSLAMYSDVAVDVADELRALVERFRASGVPCGRLIVDPGLGFAKTAEQNWQLLANLEPVRALGCRVLLGGSRKRFLAPVAEGTSAPHERDTATAALTALAARAGVWGVRVHEVVGNRQAALVGARWRGAEES